MLSRLQFFIFIYFVLDVTVNLSLGNPSGTVLESNGAMLVLIDIYGLLDTDITLTVETFDGEGERPMCLLNSCSSNNKIISDCSSFWF